MPARERCRLYLVATPAADPAGFRAELEAALEGGDVASVELAMLQADPAAVAARAVGALFSEVDVSAKISDALPTRAKFLGDTIAAQAQGYAVDVTEKLFALPDEQLVYPGHDYTGRRVSSIGQEKARNPRLGQERSMADFELLMAGLNLPYPKFIDYAVPGNRLCGVCPEDLPQQLQAYCQRMSDSPQG